MQKSVREKVAVQDVLRRSLQALKKSFTKADDAELDQRRHFFREETTVRRVYLRHLAYTHEHMEQMIAYMDERHEPSMGGLEAGSSPTALMR